jgi:hypothetical protein
MKLCMYIMTTEPISTAYFINLFHQSVCLYVYSLIVARQRLGKNTSAGTYTRSNRRIVGCIVFRTIRRVSREAGHQFFVDLCETRHRKYKRLILDGGQAYDRSSY